MVVVGGAHSCHFIVISLFKQVTTGGGVTPMSVSQFPADLISWPCRLHLLPQSLVYAVGTGLGADVGWGGQMENLREEVEVEVMSKGGYEGTVVEEEVVEETSEEVLGWRRSRRKCWWSADGGVEGCGGGSSRWRRR